MSTSIGDALFTKAQQKLLALFFGQPDKSFYLNEVVRLAEGQSFLTKVMAQPRIDLLQGDNPQEE